MLKLHSITSYLMLTFALVTKNASALWILYKARKSTYALSIKYIASGIGGRISRTLLSWYFPSVIWIKAGILPLKSSNVWIFTAPRQYLPCAQLNNLILKDIVVESSANTSLSILTLGMELFEYSGLTLDIRYSPNSAKILQSRRSFARDKVDWFTFCFIPKW